jgi:hypothetical protein
MAVHRIAGAGIAVRMEIRVGWDESSGEQVLAARP